MYGASAPAPTGRLPSRLYAVLSMGKLNLMLIHSEVRSLEPASAIQRQGPDDEQRMHQFPGHSVAQFVFEGRRWPVFCLGEDLAPLSEIPPARQVCALLGDGKSEFGLLCDQIQTVEGRQPNCERLPECMRVATSPLVGLALDLDRVYCLTTTAHLARFLREADLADAAVKDDPPVEQRTY